MYEEKPKTLLEPKLSKSYGNIYLLDEIAKNISLEDILKSIFDDDYECFITLVHYIICVDSSLSNSPEWMDLNEVLLKTELSSQYISSFLKTINDDKILEFFKQWVSKRIEKEYIAFDITSISSYSELIDFVELGYNRDKEKLPQINMGMFFGKESALPIFYNIYPGSIKDVKTLSNMLTPFKSALATSKVAEVKESIKNPSKCIAFNELVYGETITSIWKYTDDNGEEKLSKVYYHIMYDDDKRNEVENRILSKVQKLKKSFDDYINEYHRLPKNLEIYEGYLNIQKGRKISCTIKDDVINNEMKNEGFMVVISNDLKDVQNVFKTYRRKDVVEKAFDNLKNDLDVKRLKIHSVKAMKGKMFIAFIALIIKTAIYNKILVDGSMSKYDVNKVIKEMQKISIIKFNEDISMLTEITSAQRKIMKSFEIKEPKVMKSSQ